MFSGKVEEYVFKEDSRFEKVMEMLHRCNTVMKANSTLIEHQNKKADQFISRRAHRKGQL
jgi:hypothetical protein